MISTKIRKLSTIIKFLYRAFCCDDEYAKFALSEGLVNLIYPKYKFSEFGRIFLEDNKFIYEYYIPYCGNNFHSLDRKYFLKELINLVNHIEGETAECGVYLGASSHLICSANKKSMFNKTHFIFDSFEGLSLPDIKDGKYWKKADLSMPEHIVKKNLRMFKNCKFFKGWIPDRFSEASKNNFSFVHIDVDLYQPTIDSLNFFYKRLVKGGILLCDDYGFSSCPGAKLAMDEFFKKKPERVIHAPTGQAFIIKI